MHALGAADAVDDERLGEPVDVERVKVVRSSFDLGRGLLLVSGASMTSTPPMNVALLFTSSFEPPTASRVPLTLMYAYGEVTTMLPAALISPVFASSLATPLTSLRIFAALSRSIAPLVIRLTPRSCPRLRATC